MMREEEDLMDIFNIDKRWDKPSWRKSWTNAKRLRKIENRKYAKGLLMEALHIQALCFLPGDEKDPTKNIFPLIITNGSLV